MVPVPGRKVAIVGMGGTFLIVPTWTFLIKKCLQVKV